VLKFIPDCSGCTAHKQPMRKRHERESVGDQIGLVSRTDDEAG